MTAISVNKFTYKVINTASRMIYCTHLKHYLFFASCFLHLIGVLKWYTCFWVLLFLTIDLLIIFADAGWMDGVTKLIGCFCGEHKCMTPLYGLSYFKKIKDETPLLKHLPVVYKLNYPFRMCHILEKQRVLTLINRKEWRKLLILMVTKP